MLYQSYLCLVSFSFVHTVRFLRIEFIHMARPTRVVTQCSKKSAAAAAAAAGPQVNAVYSAAGSAIFHLTLPNGSTL